MLSNFSKTGITLISVVLHLFSLVLKLRLRQDYDCVLSDLRLYNFTKLICQSKVAHVKKNAPFLVVTKRSPKGEEYILNLKFVLLIYSSEMY